jgi:DNA helicase-2/ATP-dependent DNA helicase PcrA
VEEYAPQLLNYLRRIEETAAHYTSQKKAFGLLDYDDLLYFTETMLAENNDLRQRLGQRFRYLLIDEYQDTNAVQARLVDALAIGRRNVMVVGDDSQSIYRFRGARIENILEFTKTFPGARVVKLEDNYRSSKSILDLTNHIISASRQGFAKTLRSNKPDGPKPLLLRPRTEKEQSSLVVERIKHLLGQGAALGQIAVLFRSSYDSYQLEVDLAGRQLPFVKVGGFRFLEAQHNKDVMAHLRVVANPHDFISWERLLKLLPGIGSKRGRAIVARIAQASSPLEALAQEKPTPSLRELISLMQALGDENITPLKAVKLALDYYEPICRDSFEDYPRRLRDLAEIAALAEPYQELDQFMAEVVLEPPVQSRSAPQEECLTLSTVHSAKGLEWEHVFILWASQGRFPPLPALLDPLGLEEERRLMYVACTRAASTLTILAPCQHYSFSQGTVSLSPSIFVENVPEQLLKCQTHTVFNLPYWAQISAAGGYSAPPKARAGSQEKPFPDGSLVRHPSFGSGMVMGYQGKEKIMVNFERLGLKILLLKYAGLEKA